MGTLRLYLVGVLATFSIASTNAPAATAETNPVRTQPATISQGSTQRLLVKLRSTAASTGSQAQPATNTIQALTTRVNLALVESRQITAGLHAMHVVPVPGETIAATLARLRADASVEYAEPAQPAAIDATTAWDTATGRSDIVIGDLDTGIRFDHPDLGAVPGNRLLPGYDFISDPLVANDGGGRDPDASDPGGWVTAADAATPTFSGCTVANSSWHGTRTAGILGAITNNSTGIAGITSQTMILPVRVLGKCGGLDSDILDAMRWAAGLQVAGVPNNPHPAQIINMSLASRTNNTRLRGCMVRRHFVGLTARPLFLVAFLTPPVAGAGADGSAGETA